MFKVGDVVYVDPNSDLNWVDENTALFRNNGPYTISHVETKDTAALWQNRNELFILLRELGFWVNEKCLIPANSYNAIECKIAHLYKLFDERKK